MFTQVRHTGLVVNNLENALLFYQGLGFTIVSRDVESGEFIEQVTGLPDSCLEWVKLSLGDNFLLELLQYRQPDSVTFVSENALQKGKIRGYPSQMHGCSHLAYTTSDIQACCERIERLGGSLVNPPVISPNGRVKVAYAHDPEGILLEIVEELNYA